MQEYECDPVEQAISRNAGGASNLQCQDVPSADEALSTDVAEDAIARNSSPVSSLNDRHIEETVIEVRDRESDPAEFAISRNAGVGSDLRWNDPDAPEEAGADVAEDTIARNSSPVSSLNDRGIQAEEEEEGVFECDPAQMAIGRSAGQRSDLYCHDEEAEEGPSTDVAEDAIARNSSRG